MRTLRIVGLGENAIAVSSILYLHPQKSPNKRMPMAYDTRGQLMGEEARLELSGSEKYDITPMNIQEKQRFCYLDVSKL